MTDYFVIVVDDDADSLANAKGLLEGQYSKVRAVRSGADLLKITAKQDPDLILLDILMPEMDGFEAYRQLREQEKQLGRTPAPVIFLTGENDTIKEQQGLNIGASDYIRKPFNREILLKRIQNAIQSAKMIENLTEEATVDKMTGLLNKAGAAGRVPDVCAEAEGTLSMLDLDNFKLVNDLYGHEMGDGVLKAFAGILKESAQEGDVLCRIGGDEFMVFSTGIRNEKEVSGFTRELNEGLKEECRKLMGAGFDLPIGVSVGAALVPEHSDEYLRLFEYADSSMYRVKNQGKHDCCVYKPHSDEGCGAKELDAELLRLTQIMEERGDGSGALLLGMEDFMVNYRYIMRYIRRYGKRADKAIISLELKAKHKESELGIIVAEFAGVLQKAFRSSDIIMQYKEDCFVLLLPEMGDKTIADVMERVMEMWKGSEYRDAVEIRYVSAGVGV